MRKEVSKEAQVIWNAPNIPTYITIIAHCRCLQRAQFRPRETESVPRSLIWLSIVKYSQGTAAALSGTRKAYGVLGEKLAENKIKEHRDLRFAANIWILRTEDCCSLQNTACCRTYQMSRHAGLGERCPRVEWSYSNNWVELEGLRDYSLSLTDSPSSSPRFHIDLSYSKRSDEKCTTMANCSHKECRVVLSCIDRRTLTHHLCAQCHCKSFPPSITNKLIRSRDNIYLIHLSDE